MFQLLYSQSGHPGIVGFNDAGAAVAWITANAGALDWCKWVRRPALPLYH